MARVGMKWPLWAKIVSETPGQMPEYDEGIVVGGAVSGNIAFQRNNAEQYADDVLKESDNSVTGGTVSLEVDTILAEARKQMMGFVENEDGSMDMTGDSSPWGGYGYVREESVNDVKRYSALWCFKVMMGQSNVSDQTRGQNTTYGTSPMEGKMAGVIPDKDMKIRFYRYNEFGTLAEAWEWLKTLANFAGEHP